MFGSFSIFDLQKKLRGIFEKVILVCNSFFLSNSVNALQSVENDKNLNGVAIISISSLHATTSIGFLE